MVGFPLRARPAYFTTLTYHFGAGIDPAKWYADLHAFWRRLRNDYAHFGPSVFWVKEFQKRGAVHFHLVVGWRREPHLVQYRKWVARAWNEIAEPGDTLHWMAGTNVEEVRIEEADGVRKFVFYVAKYLSKAQQKRLIDRESGELMPTGRMWGTFGDWPDETIEVRELDDEELAQLYRRLRRWRRGSPFFEHFGITKTSGLIIGEPSAVQQLVRGLGTVATQLDRAPP